MKKKSKTSTSAWVVYFVGFEDAPTDKAGTTGAGATDVIIEPRVGYEKFEFTGDDAQQKRDADMAAFLRGGQVLAIVEEDDEKVVQSVAAALEKQILRMR
ncbi:MAG: hypothetical protein H7Z14_15165 [Anaerolineae bacterium]|nr:hypothetical protein [Phycisphaerae bacterium]